MSYTVLSFYGISIALVTSFFLFFLFFFCLGLLVFVFLHQCVYLFDWSFCEVVGTVLSFSLVVDWVSVSFVCVVVFISFSVIWFSFYYMGADPFVLRFTWMVIFFVLSMIILIFVPSLVGLLLGWDGLGLVSFCLVIYYQNFKSLGSGMLTVLANRVGDVMLLLSIGWCVGQGLWHLFFMVDFYMCSVVAFCVVLAGMTKSAQFPFCSWLPAAMAAPTPVSALVHSSTLVTAGVFLVIRFYDFLCLFGFFLQFLFYVSLVTMVLAGVSALFEMDLKKVIALSTLSQLSVMLAGVSLGFPLFGLFHLYTHALFKALLFLCAGSLIHCFSHAQDLRFLGACWGKMPVVMGFLNIANLALSGFPFLAGYYSKDLILEYSLFTEVGFFSVFFLFFATTLTVAYSVRLTFFGLWSSSKFCSMLMLSDSEGSVVGPMFFLGSGAVFSGSFFSWFLFSYSGFFFFVSSFEKMFVVCVLFFGLLLGWQSFSSSGFLSSVKNPFSFLVSFINCSMWFLQNSSTQLLLFSPLMFSFKSLYLVDRGWSEFLGGQGLFSLFGVASGYLNFLTTKSVLVLLSFFVFSGISVFSLTFLFGGF